MLVAGMGLLAAGVVGVHVELGRFFGMLGMTPTMTYGIASALATGALVMVVTLLGPEARWVLAFAMPTLLVLAFWWARRSVFPNRKTLYRESAVELLIPYRFMTTSVVQGLALGAPMGFLCLTGLPSQELDSAGYALAALLALVVVLVFQVDFNRSIYQIGFPIAGIGLILAGVLGAGSQMAGLLQVMGFIYLDLVLWGLGSYLIKNCDQPAIWLSACPSAALMFGRAVGVTVGAIAFQVLPDGEGFFCTLAFLVLMAALLLMSNSNLRTGWGFVRPGGADEVTDSGRTCEVIAQEYGLTQREQEIMYNIICGRTRKEIAEELYIAPNTIKTHLHNLYGKLDIHSEADLKAFVAKRERMFSTDDGSLQE
ncbi:MAG: helix-turn-helix transcriptional regulator [Eggerthellaceae bacterium]|nr:helix-turn-helix transcriptional regulator [Eggerthellaceae bacterium]